MSSPDKSEPWRNGWRVEYAARSLSHPPLPPCFPIGISASRPNAFNFKARNLKSELHHTPTLTALDSHRPAGSHHITRRIFSLIMEPRHWRHLCKPPGTLCGAVRFLRLPTRRPCYICTYVLAAAWPLYDSESPHLRLRAALDRVGFRSILVLLAIGDISSTLLELELPHLAPSAVELRGRSYIHIPYSSPVKTQY